MPFHRTVVLVLASPVEALACSPCRTMVFAAVLDSNFVPTLMMLLLPVAVLVSLAIWLFGTTEPTSADRAQQP
jgi:hypothetical protein